MDSGNFVRISDSLILNRKEVSLVVMEVYQYGYDGDVEQQNTYSISVKTKKKTYHVANDLLKVEADLLMSQILSKLNA
jgi:hypothetical protein